MDAPIIWIILPITVHYGTLQFKAIRKKRPSSDRYADISHRNQAEGVGITADWKHRSIANMVEVMIWNYCGRKGAAIAEPAALFVEYQKTPKNSKKK